MKKILLIFGTRPEAIKMAPLILELRKNAETYKISVCVTGQHRQMLDQVLNLFNIVPNYDLNVMQSNQDLFDLSSRILLGVRDVLLKEEPDLVLVHGDTTTSIISALAAFYQKIPVGHIEAGLRTDNKYSPFPEEINRELTSRIATYHFAPTQQAKFNLLQEHILENNIVVTGNTVIDALFHVTKQLTENSPLCSEIESQLGKAGFVINPHRRIVLITGHRRENFGEGLINICSAIKKLAIKYKDVDFIYPVHLNPHVQEAVNDILSDDKLSNVYLIKPLDYLPFVYLMSLSYCILTDSGGIQEEAPSLGIPVLVMRDTTERPEAVDMGTVLMVGTNTAKIETNVSKLLEDTSYHDSFSHKINPYGNGYASQYIVEYLNKIIK